MSAYTTTNYRKLLARVLQYFSTHMFAQMVLDDEWSNDEAELLTTLYNADVENMPD